MARWCVTFFVVLCSAFSSTFVSCFSSAFVSVFTVFFVTAVVGFVAAGFVPIVWFAAGAGYDVCATIGSTSTHARIIKELSVFDSIDTPSRFFRSANATSAPASAEQVAKDPRDRRGEAEALAGRRMGKAEELRVQAEAAQRVRRSAVELIAGNRMPGLGEMRADLVLPSRLQRHLEHRVRLLHLDGAVVRDGQLGLGVRRVAAHEKVASLVEMRADRAVRRLDVPFDDGDVEPVGAVRRELLLQRLARLEGLGEDEYARGLAVEAMHDVD